MDLPPTVSEDLLLKLPRRHREDAAQEAWLGYLRAERDGDDPVAAGEQAIVAYGRQERKHDRRQVELTPKLINRVFAQNLSH